MVYFTVSALQRTAAQINHCLPPSTDGDGKTDSRFHGVPQNANFTAKKKKKRKEEKEVEA